MTTSPSGKPVRLSDDVAYILPMAIFLACIWVGSTWPGLFISAYVARTFLSALALYLCWKHYTRITWSHFGLAVVVGVVGLFQWVYFDKGVNAFFQYAHAHFGGVLDWVPVYGKIGIQGVPTDSFNPFESIHSPLGQWSFIVIRIACATLTVPVMEELFWRDFLWRSIAAPADFKLAAVGERDTKAIILVALAFSSVHIQWITAIVWGLLIAWLLIRTRSLGACIIAHAVTNLALAFYVLLTHDWYYW